MHFDRKNIPYRNLFDRFLKPSKRLDKALSKTDVDLVVALIESGHAPVNFRLSPLERASGMSSYQDNGSSLLHWLVFQKSYKGVESLLMKGADPNIRTFFNETPAHWAAENADEEMLLILFKHGADFTICQSQRGSFALEDPYTPNVFQIFKGKSGQNLSAEDFSSRILRRSIEQNIECDAPERKRKM